ncbi:MAG: CHAD domain-containing protein [Tepidimonas sp.]|nr:CHAD domain-containing protein [Tepidimonas sp.]
MPQEIELKFALPGLTGEESLARLRRHPLLRRRAMQQVHLINRYLDTPDGWLRQQRCALRLRATQAVGSAAAQPPRWEQTLKTAGQGAGAWSARGEWTVALKGPRLQPQALLATPLGQQPQAAQRVLELQARYETRCLRTTWTLHLRGRAVIEVALDAGEVRAGHRRAPLLELELELLRGDAAALDEVAAALATTLPLLPARTSKAEQAQRLADGTWGAPVRAQGPTLPVGADPLTVARAALADALGQLCDNLAAAARSDDPELIHQARVGWRRWRSVLRLVRPWLTEPVPDTTALRALLQALGVLRDLDVAYGQTVPSWGEAFVEDAQQHPRRARALQRATRRLRHAAQQARAELRTQLSTPEVVAPLQALAAWLLRLTPATVPVEPGWAFERLRRWHARLKRQLRHGNASPAEAMAALHAARLLAKRLRYASEAAGHAMPAKAAERAQQWQRRARGWQERLGRWRDTVRAAELLQQLHADAELVGFLRGVAAAQHPLQPQG